MRSADRVFRNDVVRLADHTLNSMELNGYEFSNCRIIGPAVLLPVGSTSIVNCSWDVPDIDTMFWEITSTRQFVVGAIAAIDCIFSACAFQGVGLAGPPELRAVLEAGFSS